MAHKTLIDGTAYEISGGRTLVDGTTYSIDKGKTLVDGTAYEVGFEPAIMYSITTASSGSASGSLDRAYIYFFHPETGDTVYINSACNGFVGELNSGTTFDALNSSFELPAGTVITCYVNTKGSLMSTTITVNGTVVASVKGGGTTYDYTVVSNAEIKLKSSSTLGSITITET